MFRRRSQLDRIVNCEFPWLWAVKEAWDENFNTVEILPADEKLSRILCGGPSLVVSFTTWIHVTHKSTWRRVTRISRKPEQCIAQDILDWLAATEYRVAHIVFALEGMATGRVLLYRPAKGQRDFNPLVANIARDTRLATQATPH